MSYENRQYRKHKRRYDEAMMRQYFRANENKQESILFKGIILCVIGMILGFVFPYMGV